VHLGEPKSLGVLEKKMSEPVQLSSTERRQAGHYEVLGETFAKFEFFQNGWNPYSRFLDVDKVDLLLRRTTEGRRTYREVQVKYGKLYRVGSRWEQQLFDYTSWRFFREDEFTAHEHLSDFFMTYVLAPDEGYRGDIFIFPIREFVKLCSSQQKSKKGIFVASQRRL